MSSLGGTWRHKALVVSVSLAVVACTSPDESATFEGPETTKAPTSAKVVERDFQLTFDVEGVVVAGEPIPLAPAPELIVAPSVPEGSRVKQSATIGDAQLAGDFQVETEDVSGQRRLRLLQELTGPVNAPIAGTLERQDGRMVLSGPGDDVTWPLTSAQRLRVDRQALTGRAEVETAYGPVSVPCRAVWFEGEITPDGGGSVRCRLPAAVGTAPGLRGSGSVSTQVFPDSLVVPNAYVGVDFKTNESFVLTPATSGSDPKRVTVEPGLTDGVVRVITSKDLKPGTELVLPPIDG